MQCNICRASETESCSPKIENLSTEASSDFGLSTHQRIGIYGGIVGFNVIIIIARVVLFYLVVLAASCSLHGEMLTSILRTPILFFDTNPVGKCFNYVFVIYCPLCCY